MNKSKHKSWMVKDQWSSDAAWFGTAMIYAASGTGSYALSGDYEVSFANESQPEDMRAARLFKSSQGELVDKVSHDKLGDELVVIFGASITALKAVQTLRALVARIESEGLIIGRVGHGDFVHEKTTRELTADDAAHFDVED